MARSSEQRRGYMSHAATALQGHFALTAALTVLLLVLVPFAALFFGRFGVTLPQVIGALLPSLQIEVPEASATLVLKVRLPRILAAMAVGAALAASGAAFQGVFRNPLVNPGLLGVSNGAGLGAACAIVFFGGGLAIYPAAFTLGLAAVGASYWISRVYRSSPTIMLILGGMIVSSVASALVSLLKYVADPATQLPDIVYWLMGSLSSTTWGQFWALLPIGAGLATLFIMSWRIDVLSMGDKEARTLGLDAGRDKLAIIAAATLATAGAVCISGTVGWIGLVVPHIGRILAGSANRRLVPLSAALGAIFLVIVDTCARCLTAGELPLGILTALIGAPFFVYLLKKTKGAGW